jgi:hypothetical protein
MSISCVTLVTLSYGAPALLPNDLLADSDISARLQQENALLRKRIAQLEQKQGAPPPVPVEPATTGEQQTYPKASVVLDKERLTAVGGPSRQIILTFVNTIRLDFAATWAAHMRRLGLTNWLVGATDNGALSALLRDGTPCFDMHTSLPTGEWAWGSPSFKSLGPAKVRLIHHALSWGMELVITDIDALVLREPFGFMARWPDAGFLTTSDHLSNTTNDDGLENHNGIHTAFNIGSTTDRSNSGATKKS